MTGLLGEAEGLRASLPDPSTLRIEADGQEPLDVPVRENAREGKTYLDATLSKVLGSPAMAAALDGKVNADRKTISLHQLVMALDKGVDLRPSDAGRLAVHHANLNTGDNRAANLWALRTPTHTAFHKWEGRLTAQQRRAYVDSIPGSADGLGDGLPDDLRAAIAADRQALESSAPQGAVQHPHEGGSGEEDPGDGHLEEEASTATKVPSDDSEEDVQEDEGQEDENYGEEYYPDGDLVSGIADGENVALSVEELQATGRRLGSPSELDLYTMDGRRRKMLTLADELRCGVTTYLLDRGHHTLNSAAVQETLEGADEESPERIPRFIYDAGILFRYDWHHGRYEDWTEAFKREVADYVAIMNDELRKIRMAASVWPIKEASQVMMALPKARPTDVVINDCVATLFRRWTSEQKMNSDPWTLNFTNGLLDLHTYELLPHTPDHPSSVQLPFPYDPTATCPTWDTYLAAAQPDPGTRDVLQEFTGYTLIPDTTYEKALFLHGSGGTGKSTYIKISRKLVGEENCSAVGLEDLGEKFRVGQLRFKLLNVVTEVNPTTALNDARFKAFVSGDPVIGEQKFKDPGVFQPHARFLIAANTMPRITDPTDAFYRRLIVVQFNQKFVPNPNPEAMPPELPADPGLEAKLVSELPGIMQWALRGLQRLRERTADPTQRVKGFIIPGELQLNVRELRKSQDNVMRYLYEQCVFAPGLEVTTGELYGAYVAWCKAHHEKPRANNVFGLTLSNIQGVEAMHSGKRGRFYRGLRPADASSLAALGQGDA